MFSPKPKITAKVAVARTPSLANIDVDASVVYAKHKASLVDEALEAMDAFSYAMPVRQQSSAWGGLLTIAAMGLMMAVSLVNLQDFYLGERGGERRRMLPVALVVNLLTRAVAYLGFWGLNGSISKETSSPTDDPESIPQFGINVRIDNQDVSEEAYKKYFRWRFQVGLGAKRQR